MKKKLNEKKKMMAYVLNTDPEFDCSQKKIGDLLEVSQSAISTGIKEVKMLKKIYDLEDELAKAKQQIADKNMIEVEQPRKLLPYKILE